MNDIKELLGLWHISEMEAWDEDYFNMEVQAFIEIMPAYRGRFQFGLVRGRIDIDEIVDNGRMDFTLEGADENEEVSGSGWLKLSSKNRLEGKIKFHQGDSSTFVAKRAV